MTNTLNKILFLLSLMVIPKLMPEVKGQNSDSWITITSNPLTFNLSNSTSLETTQTIVNGIFVTIKSKFNSYNLSARITNQSQSTGTPIPDGTMGLRFNPPTPTTIFYLTTTNINLLSNQGKTTGNSTDKWNFDLILNPIGYLIKPGNYSYTVLYTMSPL